jgi:hypothetical protein
MTPATNDLITTAVHGYGSPHTLILESGEYPLTVA